MLKQFTLVFALLSLVSLSACEEKKTDAAPTAKSAKAASTSKAKPATSAKADGDEGGW